MKASRSTLAASSPAVVLPAVPAGVNVQAWPSQCSLPAAGHQSETQTASAAMAPTLAAATIHGDAGPDGVAAAHATSADTTAAPIEATATRQTPNRHSATSQGGEPRTDCAAERRHTRLKTRVPLVPPKPKLFLTAYSIFISRAALAQ